MEREISSLVITYLQDLYAAGMTEESARAEVLKELPHLQEWAKRFLLLQPQKNGEIKNGGPINVGPHHYQLAVNKVLDIEENVWSPKFGIKGKIDVSIQGEAIPFDPKG